MTNIIKPNQGILFMKVGVHAQETLEDIIKRKQQEIEEAGFAFWGYGGNTCHPTTMVQPFAQKFTQQGGRIFLCMQEMNSKHYAEPERAKEYSTDGLKWQEIPPSINVLGSRYALAIKDLHAEQLKLPLDRSVVAVGNSIGRRGNKYIAGRVDKACLSIIDEENDSELPDEANTIEISLVAELCDPYAVFLK